MALESVSQYENKWSSLFQNNTPFYQPYLFMGKIWTPLPFLQRIWNLKVPLYKKGISNYAKICYSTKFILRNDNFNLLAIFYFIFSKIISDQLHESKQV